MNNVTHVLEHMGYHEVQRADDDWTPTEDLNGEFGTTDDVHVIVWKRKPTAVLRDPETGECVATARASCPLF